MKAWIASAVKPFMVVAKQHLSPEAGPIAEAMCETLRVKERWAPETGALANSWGPETGMLGRVQDVEVLSLAEGVDNVVVGFEAVT